MHVLKIKHEKYPILINSFNRYLLSTYYMPGSDLGAADASVNTHTKNKVPVLMKLTF